MNHGVSITFVSIMVLLQGCIGMIGYVEAADPEVGERRMEFVVYSLSWTEDAMHLVVHATTVVGNAFDFIDDIGDVEYDERSIGRPNSDTSSLVLFRATLFDGEGWIPLNVSGFRLFIGKDLEDTPEDSFVMKNGTRLNWITDRVENGTASLEIHHPDIVSSYLYLIEVDMGEGVWERVDGSYHPCTLFRPLRKIDFVVYRFNVMEPGVVLEIYHHTYQSLDVALGEINNTTPRDFDRVQSLIEPVRNTSATIIFRSLVMTSSLQTDWEPNTNGSVRFYVSNGHRTKFEPYYVTKYYEYNCSESCNGTIDIKIPETLSNYQVQPAANLSWKDPVMIPDERNKWNLRVHPPQSIYITDLVLSPDHVQVGELVFASGYVRYLYTNSGVHQANLTIDGDFMATSFGSTDYNGRFSIAFQAPIKVTENPVIMVYAIDDSTWETANQSLHYVIIDGNNSDDPKDDPDQGWFQFPSFMVAFMVLLFVSAIIVTVAINVYRPGRGPPKAE
jgi:hypothetical protein